MNIIDTAGIRKTDDIVEKIGVEKSIQLLDQADLVLFVLNNNEEISKDELEILDQIKDKNYIVVINKIDLPMKLSLKFNTPFIIKMSNLEKTGLEDLKNAIKKMFDLEQNRNTDFTYLTNSKDIAILKKALKGIKDIQNSIIQNVPIDMLEIDIKEIWNLLGEITAILMKMN